MKLKMKSYIINSFSKTENREVYSFFLQMQIKTHREIIYRKQTHLIQFDVVSSVPSMDL